jgi:hypothetical protein
MNARAIKKFEGMSEVEQKYRQQRRSLVCNDRTPQWVLLSLPELDRLILEGIKLKATNLQNQLKFIVGKEHASLRDADKLCKQVDDLILQSLSDEYNKYPHCADPYS